MYHLENGVFKPEDLWGRPQLRIFFLGNALLF